MARTWGFSVSGSSPGPLGRGGGIAASAATRRSRGPRRRRLLVSDRSPSISDFTFEQGQRFDVADQLLEAESIAPREDSLPRQRSPTIASRSLADVVKMRPAGRAAEAEPGERSIRLPPRLDHCPRGSRRLRNLLRRTAAAKPTRMPTRARRPEMSQSARHTLGHACDRPTLRRDVWHRRGCRRRDRRGRPACWNRQALVGVCLGMFRQRRGRSGRHGAQHRSHQLGQWLWHSMPESVRPTPTRTPGRRILAATCERPLQSRLSARSASSFQR